MGATATPYWSYRRCATATPQPIKEWLTKLVVEVERGIDYRPSGLREFLADEFRRNMLEISHDQ